MRKILLFLFVFTAALNLKAQDSYNYSKYGVGFNLSAVRPYADLKLAKDSYAFNATAYYNLTPYIPIGLELQIGQLKGGSIESQDLDFAKRQYDNHYKALILHGDLQLGEVIDYSGSFFMGLVKDLYIGAGVGLINNNMAFVQRTNLVVSTAYPVGTYTFPGMDKSINLMVPVRFGYEFKLYDSYGEPFMGLSIGYNHSFTWGEGLDGYTDPASGFKNNALDQYRQIVVGVKFNFGTSVPYTKQINY